MYVFATFLLHIRDVSSILILNYIHTYCQNARISRILVLRYTTINFFPVQFDLLALHLTGFPNTQRVPLRQWETELSEKKTAVVGLLELGMELFRES